MTIIFREGLLLFAVPRYGRGHGCNRMVFDDDDEDGKAQVSPCHESNQKKITLYMNEGL